MSVAVIGALAPVFTVAVDFFVVRTTVTSRGHDAERWISQILRRHRNRLHELVVGLDVEWRAGDRIRNPVSVLQICVGFRCLVFQVLHTDFFPPNLVAFLLDHRFTFVGVGIQNDVERLTEGWNLNVGNTVDLCTLAVNKTRREDLRNAGLQRLAEEVLGLVVEKPRRIIVTGRETCSVMHKLPMPAPTPSSRSKSGSTSSIIKSDSSSENKGVVFQRLTKRHRQDRNLQQSARQLL